MPFERESADDPREWLVRARSDLALSRAESLLYVCLADLCFHAQQAAEKSLKAVLVAKGIRFPYTHDLRRLIEALEKQGLTLPEEVWRSACLSDYASHVRCPGYGEPIEEEEHLQAVEIAKIVYQWAEGQVREMSDAPPTPED